MRTLVLAALIAAASATMIDVSRCPGVNSTVCTIHEISIDPCEPFRGGCQLKTGKDAEINFSFTPNFSTDKLSTNVMYQAAAWPNLEPDGCLATTCPTVAGTQQTYKVKLHLGKKLPKAVYLIQWSVWDTDNDSNKCCFQTKFKLVKG